MPIYLYKLTPPPYWTDLMKRRAAKLGFTYGVFQMPNAVAAAR